MIRRHANGAFGPPSPINIFFFNLWGLYKLGGRERYHKTEAKENDKDNVIYKSYKQKDLVRKVGY